MEQARTRPTSAIERCRRHVSDRLSSLHPAYFAMSMATGIVSIACHMLGLLELAHILFWINLVSYGSVWIAMFARIALFRRAFLADWSIHQRAPGFFTSVAATCVLGTQVLTLHDAVTAARVLWCAGLLLWLVCTYAVFVCLSIREEKPSLADGINGGWLLAVVATQAICVLGCRVLPDWIGNRDAALFLATSFWLCGGMLYIWMISLIFYRYTFFRFSPTDLMPPYWINMGAVAISTLAGTALVGAAEGSAFLESIRPFVKGFTILYWATATWWIPMLFVLGVWRHVGRRIAFAYDPLYWGLVFPFGMYCVCTRRLGEILDLPFLGWLSRAFLVLAIFAWMFTFSGLVTRLLHIALLAWRAIRPAPGAAYPLSHADSLAPTSLQQSHTGGLT